MLFGKLRFGEQLPCGDLGTVEFLPLRVVLSTYRGPNGHRWHRKRPTGASRVREQPCRGHVGNVATLSCAPSPTHLSPDYATGQQPASVAVCNLPICVHLATRPRDDQTRRCAPKAGEVLYQQVRSVKLKQHSKISRQPWSWPSGGTEDPY